MDILIFCVILLLLLLFIIILCVILKRPKPTRELFKNTNCNTVVLFKTHTWNSQIETFAKKLLSETVSNNIDFFILIHKNSLQIPKLGDPELSKYIITFSESDITKVYQKGFYDMWLSNHWILMWFFKKMNRYEFYWSIEYDVRIVGDSSKIFKYNGTEDFIYPIRTFQDPNWAFKDYYIGNKFTDDTKWYGYLQLARYSKKFLEYLNMHYTNNENGQDELITFSLFNRGQKEIGLTGNHQLLNNLIKDSWSVTNDDLAKHQEILEKSESEYQNNRDHLVILHPIKY